MKIELHLPTSEKTSGSRGAQPTAAIAGRSGGFSLVEIMVALVIGMLSMIVMLQVFALFEGQKRTTTGGDDAQNNGAIALYGLQRDVRQSGYGVSALDLVGCNVLLRTGITLNAMAPTTINHASIPAGDANTDTVLVVYGNANGAAEGDGITAQTATAIYAVQAPSSFSLADRVIAEPQSRPSPCNLTLATVQPDAITSDSNVNVSPGMLGVANGKLYNLGQMPKVQVYAIRNGNLTVCDYMVNDCGAAANVAPLNSTVWVPIANDIVSMRAQYGRDTTAVMDGVVDTYDQTTPTTGCGWVKISALRLVLVARNGQPEKTAVTTAAPTWVGGTINLTASTVPAGFTWQNFRYKVFQTAIPLRNITSMGAVAGC